MPLPPSLLSLFCWIWVSVLSPNCGIRFFFSPKDCAVRFPIPFQNLGPVFSAVRFPPVVFTCALPGDWLMVAFFLLRAFHLSTNPLKVHRLFVGGTDSFFATPPMLLPIFKVTARSQLQNTPPPGLHFYRAGHCGAWPWEYNTFDLTGPLFLFNPILYFDSCHVLAFF